MFYKKIKKIFLLVISSALLLSNALLNADDLEIDSFSLASESVKDKKQELTDTKYIPSYYERERSGPFISTNTGIGILYNQSKYVLASPAYEAIIGYHVGNSFKVGAAYQYQHAPLDVKIKGTALIAGRSHDFDYAMKSGLSLQSLALKLYTSPAHPYRWKIFTLSPYFSVGTGLGWVDMRDMFQARRLLFMGDVGLSAGTTIISTTAGCKYSNWSWENGMYSIIPYVGLQISF